jgi:hypothetical protein
MFIFKRTMRKYLTLLYITASVMSFAQFEDNVFEQNNAATSQQPSDVNSSVKTDTHEAGTPSGESQSSFGVPGPGEHEEGPGNPGEPVPIDGFVPFLLIAGLAFIIYYERKNKKINI